MNTESLAGLPAELIVAGKMAAVSWNIYSPHRDIGFDFIATKQISSGLIIRPVQVKGCYFRKRKDSSRYGRTDMELKQIHDEMVLAIPYFYPEQEDKLTLLFIAYLPNKQVRQKSGKYQAQPAKISNGRPSQRRDFKIFFDDAGLALLDNLSWKDMEIDKSKAG